MPSQSVTPRPWYDAWIDAATGPAGFWRRSRVRDQFRTASHSVLSADAIAALLGRPEYAAIDTVVEIGAGDGLLLDGLRRRHPHRRFVGVDVRPRPPEIVGVDWCTGIWDVRTGSWQGAAADLLAGLSGPTMIICAEWLDDLPCSIVSPSPDGPFPDGRPVGDWRRVDVGVDGSESIGGPLPAADLLWLRRWWPRPDDRTGAGPIRAESGRSRDLAWALLITALRRFGGLALMIDYGHLRTDRPAAGTLTGYAAGRQVAARPDPTINLTAHVAVDAIAAAGEESGARTRMLTDQRTALRTYLPDDHPDPEPDPLATLQRRTERRLLEHTLGDHYWLLQEIPPINNDPEL